MEKLLQILRHTYELASIIHAAVYIIQYLHLK